MIRATFRLERSLFAEGARTVAGMDEVGRGAWAGPVSVGVFVLDAARLGRFPAGVRDSKVLTPHARQALVGPLSRAGAFAVGHASNEECDELGMSAAQRLAARRALEQLDVIPDACIVDGRWDFSGFEGGARTMVDADARCLSVAAASVVAKVTRDALMASLAPMHPPYRFEQNKGYPSPEHRAAIARLGLTALHRSSWSFARGPGDGAGEQAGAVPAAVPGPATGGNGPSRARGPGQV